MNSVDTYTNDLDQLYVVLDRLADETLADITVIWRKGATPNMADVGRIVVDGEPTKLTVTVSKQTGNVLIGTDTYVKQGDTKRFRLRNNGLVITDEEDISPVVIAGLAPYL